jgi:type 1 fimbriae regulatory protein FimB
VTCPKPGGGRTRRFFKDKREARTYFELCQVQQKNHGIAAFSVSESLRIEALECSEKLETIQPMDGDEVRALRAWLRQRFEAACANSPLLFLSERGPMTRQAMNYAVAEIGRRAKLPIKVHPHMLRHSCGYALANKGYDTRLIQDYLGHRNIRHTQLYTRTAAVRFEGLWS